jgi:hypothetical protein
MFGSLSRREHAIADEATAHALTEGNEHLAYTVKAGARCTTPSLIVDTHRLPLW